MTHGEEFRIYMRAANRDQSPQNDPHLSEVRMIAYYRGQLAEADREATQAHLVSCAECVALFRSLSDFLETARADEDVITAAETNQQWESFLQRVKISSPKTGDESRTSVVQGDFKLTKRFVLDGLFPTNVPANSSFQIFAEFPDGRIEPLLWLDGYKQQFAHVFLLRTPLELPAGTVITGIPAGSSVTFLPPSKD